MQIVSSHEMTVRYRNSGPAQIVKVSTNIDSGITALIGRNGAGKSTFLKALVGLNRVSDGQLSVIGEELEKRKISPEALRKIGYLPQDFGYVASFTAREFVEYGAWLKKVPSSQIPELALVALDKVGLVDVAEKRMGRLSGGMRRRAGIAYAVVNEPQLLILDEPTTGLDPEQRIRFRSLLRSVGEGRTVLLSSHLIEDARALASKVLVLNDGRLLFDGSPQELERQGELEVSGDTPLERGYLAVIGAVEPQ